MFKPVFAAAVATGLLTCTALAQEAASLDSDIEATAGLLIDAALNDEVGLAFVEDLTTEVGQRLAGSESEKRARDWSVAELNALGFDNRSKSRSGRESLNPCPSSARARKCWLQRPLAGRQRPRQTASPDRL